MIVNGQQQQHIDIADRAIQYGDGCFTTMAFRNGYIECFNAHLARLKLACKNLYIDFDKWTELENCIVNSLTTKSDYVIKVIITRGKGGRGYSPEGVTESSYIITHHTIPSHYSDWQTDGIELTVSSITLACQPLLAGIKHLNRLEQVLVKKQLVGSGYVDAVVCDTQQKVIESSVGNLFWYNDNVWFTANVAESGVDGVMRNLVLDVMREKGLECQVVKQDVGALFEAQELFVCNSLMALVPIMSLFNPVSQQRKEYIVQQTKDLQRHVQQAINLKATKI